jgi:hypothetical protein
MIALLAAATLAAVPQPTQPVQGVRMFYAAGSVGRLEVLGANPAVCNKDPRMQQAGLDRTILRNSDQRYVAKRLIDLPMAYMCHAGGPKEVGK